MATVAKIEDIIAQLRELSDGTVANLTGFHDRDQISNVRHLAIRFATAALGSGAKYDNWMDVWRWFENSPQAERFPVMSNGGTAYTLVFNERSPEKVAFIQQSGGKGSLRSAWFESEPSHFGAYLSGQGLLIRKSAAERMYGFLPGHRPPQPTVTAPDSPQPGVTF